MVFEKGELGYRPEENKDLTIRRLDGSLFHAALPVWFNDKCYIIQGEPEGKMRAVYIVPPIGETIKLNPSTRHFEFFAISEKERILIESRLGEIRMEVVSQGRKIPLKSPKKKTWIGKIKGLLCRK